jgi:septal ring factor EnvC (AmiA/AmiB activator)
MILVCGFANQSASERVNKYMNDSAGDKKRTGLNLEKARKVLDLKVHLKYQKARDLAARREQRKGERSVAADLRALYVAARARAREEQRVKENLRTLRREMAETEEELATEGEPLITEEDAGGWLPRIPPAHNPALFIPFLSRR